MNQPAVYALEGSIAITGALVQWLRDNLGLIEKSGDVETLARRWRITVGSTSFRPFPVCLRPTGGRCARARSSGMTRYVNKGHIARAVLEATALPDHAKCWMRWRKDSGVRLTTLKVDGGMVFNELLMQFQADILNVPVIRPKVTETTALGAAYAAGLAVGFWKDYDELRINWGKDKEWKPSMPTQKARGALCKLEESCDKDF